MRFSLIIPCYNEAANLQLLLERCKELAVRPGVEVVLVDNGSTDGTAEALLNLLPQYLGCQLMGSLVWAWLHLLGICTLCVSASCT